MRRGGTPRWLWLAGGLALAFYVVNVVHYVPLPLRIEENAWPPMAKATFESGKPLIAADETHRLHINGDMSISKEETIGAWHPPLYLYTLATSMAVLGTDSPDLLRLVGAVGLLAAALLLLLIAREVTPRWRLVGGVAAILLLIHPYAIQGSLFLDIDTSIYAPLALLAIWLAIRYGKEQKPLSLAQLVAIGGSLALVTWAKMTTTIVLVGVLVAWWLLSRRPLRRAAIEAAAFVAIGAALFFSTYALWCHVTGIPFSYTFDVTFAQKSDRLFSNWLLIEHAAQWHLRWFGVGLLLLALVYAVHLAVHLLSKRRLRPLDLPFLVSIGVLIQYVALSPADGTYQGKYAFPALATMLLPVSWMLLQYQARGGRLVAWATAIAIGFAAALLMPDMLTWLSFNGDYGEWTSVLGFAAIAGAALSLSWLLAGKQGFAGGVVIVLAMLFTAQAVHSYRADSSPMYPIPDTEDFTAAIEDLSSRTSRGDIVVAPEDLGFYVDQHLLEGEEAFARGDLLLATMIRSHPRIMAFARDSFGPPVGAATETILSTCFLDHRVYDTAMVAYRNTDCGSPRGWEEARTRVAWNIRLLFILSLELLNESRSLALRTAAIAVEGKAGK